MSDKFEERSKGALQASVGVAMGSPMAIVQGVATVLGLETNATAVQRLVAAEHENFVFDTLLALKGETAQQKTRLDTFEQRQAKMAWVVEEFERRLSDQGALPSDLVALLEASFKVWKSTAEAKKRKELGNALLNAFDPKQYEEGLMLRLFGILEHLTYPELWLLRSLHDQFLTWPKNENQALKVTNSHLNSKTRMAPLRAASVIKGSLMSDHVQRLVEHGLIVTVSVAWEHEGRAPNNSLEINRTTELGERLLALTAEPATVPEP